MARVYADSALPTSKSQLDVAPDDPQLLALYGLMLAYAGRGAEAKAAITQAQTIETRAANANYVALLAVRVALALGETDDAITRLEGVLKRPYTITPAWLRVDPTFASLRGNPRFERMIAGK
jgi:Flp pilus assembly protein TadD